MLNLAEVSEKSEKRLVGLHPTVSQAARALITKSFNAGVPIIITAGLRTMEEQAKLYLQGRNGNPGPVVTNAKAGTSYHNYGLAIDYALLLPDGRTVVWDTIRDADLDGEKDWYEVAAIGKSLGFEWGGDWQGFVDMPHLQMTFGLTIASLKAGKRPPVVEIEKPKPVKKEDYKMQILDANKIIALLQQVYAISPSKEVGRLADEVRKASNQPTQNS
jgi:peptidoglycan L-alanyl-D-glutamate endopeptidase CwlK